LTAAGLPQVLVDLRHEATHNELPSLPLLRLAACQALAWLHACYWQPQFEQLMSAEARYRQLLQVDARLQTASTHHSACVCQCIG
jgi:ribosomal biogenesis protein LAS1